MKIGEKIQTIRKSKGMTQVDLFLRSGVSATTISGIECNRVEDPQISTVTKIARGLGVDVNQLVDGVDYEFDPIIK